MLFLVLVLVQNKNSLYQTCNCTEDTEALSFDAPGLSLGAPYGVIVAEKMKLTLPSQRWNTRPVMLNYADSLSHFDFGLIVIQIFPGPVKEFSRWFCPKFWALLGVGKLLLDCLNSDLMCYIWTTLWGIFVEFLHKVLMSIAVQQLVTFPGLTWKKKKKNSESENECSGYLYY